MRWILGAAVLLVALTACGSGDGAVPQFPIPLRTITTTQGTPGSGNPAQQAALAVAQKESDRFSSGDFGSAWDLWSKASKKVISRAGFVTFSKACTSGVGGIGVDGVDLDTPDRATAQITLGDSTFKFRMLRENGRWTWVPSKAQLKIYALGAKEAITQSQALGICVTS